MKAKFLAGVAAVALIALPTMANASFVPDYPEEGGFYATGGLQGQFSWMHNFEFGERSGGGSFFDFGQEPMVAVPYISGGFVLGEPLIGSNTRFEFNYSGAWYSSTMRERETSGAGGSAFFLDGAGASVFASPVRSIRFQTDYEFNRFGVTGLTDFEVAPDTTYSALAGVTGGFSSLDSKLSFVEGSGDPFNFDADIDTSFVGIKLGGFITHKLTPDYKIFGGATITPMVQWSSLKARADYDGSPSAVNDSDTQFGVEVGVAVGIGIKLTEDTYLTTKGSWNWQSGQPGIRDARNGRPMRIQHHSGSNAGITAVITYELCWVARAVYGADNPDWLRFRHWLLTAAPRWFRNLYIAHGERFAAWVADKPRIKNLIRAWMDTKLEGAI